MSADRTQETIEDLQRKIDAERAQIQQAEGRDQQELVVGLEQSVAEYQRQIDSLQSQLNDERRKEAEEAAEQAREEQKKEDKGLLGGLF